MRRHATAVTSGVLVAVGLFGLVFALTSPSQGDLNPYSRAVYFANPVLIAAVGGIILASKPGHWAGRTFLVAAATFDADSLAKGLLYHHLHGEIWTRALVPWAAWIDNWTWTIPFMAVVFVVLKFAGTQRRGRWLRIVGWVGIAAFGVLMFFTMAVSTSADFRGVPTIVSGGIKLSTGAPLVGTAFGAGYLGIVASVVAVIMRYRTSRGAEHAQLRWLMWAFASIVIFALIAALTQPVLDALHIHAPAIAVATDVLQELSMFTLPFAVFISITRHGLFEIDRVVSRTVSYTALILLLTIGYVAIVTSATRLLPDRFGSLPVAGATLIIAAAFVPVRRLLVARIDRRFNRARYDAERIIGAFAERVRQHGADDAEGIHLLAAIEQAFQPTVATVWLIGSGRQS